MGFKKGESGNLSGRPKGCKSEKTLFWDEIKEWFMEEGAEKYIKEMKTLKGRHYVDAYSAALEFFQPKLSRVESKSEVDNKVTIQKTVIHK